MTLTDEHLTAVGRVAVMHGHLEFSVTTALERLISPDDVRIATNVIPSMLGRKLTLLKRLVHVLAPDRFSPEAIKRFDTLMQQAEAVNAERNGIMHAYVWGTKEIALEEHVSAIFSRGKDGAIDAKAMPVKDIERIAAQLKNVNRDFVGFLFEHRILRTE